MALVIVERSSSRPLCEMGDAQYFVSPEARHWGYIKYEVLRAEDRVLLIMFGDHVRCDGSTDEVAVERGLRQKAQSWAKENGHKLVFS